MPGGKPKKSINPFYVILILVGVAFAVTACAYGMMAVRMLDPSEVAELPGQQGALIEFLDQRGFQVMLVELGLLAAATFAAMATDQFGARRNERPAAADEDETSGEA